MSFFYATHACAYHVHRWCFVLQELNRLRRASLCYSFLDLLDTLAAILEKESAKASSDAETQLQHAAACLREASKYDLNHNITPLLE